MKKSKARKMKFCSIDFTCVDEVRAFDTLLSRVLGADSFSIRKAKKSKAYTFIFWATPKEIKSIDILWNQVLDMKWSEEEFEKLLER